MTFEQFLGEIFNFFTQYGPIIGIALGIVFLLMATVVVGIFIAVIRLFRGQMKRMKEFDKQWDSH